MTGRSSTEIRTRSIQSLQFLAPANDPLYNANTDTEFAGAPVWIAGSHRKSRRSRCVAEKGDPPIWFAIVPIGAGGPLFTRQVGPCSLFVLCQKRSESASRHSRRPQAPLQSIRDSTLKRPP